MSTLVKLRLRENNYEEVILTATRKRVPRNIVGCLLEVYIKIDANQSDADADVLSLDDGHIEIDESLTGVATLHVPGEVLTPNKTFWRYDIIDGNSRKTHISGPLEVVNL